MTSRLWRTALGLVLVGATMGSATSDPVSTRVVAVGDVHGSVERLTAILRTSRLIDETGAWIAGDRATFVQVGDFTDRGSGVRAVMDLLMMLEQRAAAAGARAHILLGNHEAMNLLGETRDVTPEIFATFAGVESQARREEAWHLYEKFGAARLARLGNGAPPVLGRDEWMAAHPPGYLEYRDAFAPGGHYGRWLRARPAVVRIGDTIFLHGGIHPQMAPSRIEDLNRQVDREIRQFADYRRHMVERGLILPFFTLQEVVDTARAELQAIAMARDRALPGGDPDRRHLDVLQGITRIGTWALLNPNGPLWFRGYATWTSAEGAPQVTRLLEKYGARRFVVGHTILSSMRITPRFDSRVFLIDTGMLSTHYEGGRSSALEIVGDRVTALYEEGEIPLVVTQATPRSGDGRESRTSPDAAPRTCEGL